jgi:hypothetical protein
MFVLDGQTSADKAACWDTPPPQDSPLWPAFAAAFKAYFRSRTVTIPVLSTALAKKRDSEAATIFKPFKEQPKCIVGGVSSTQLS